MRVRAVAMLVVLAACGETLPAPVDEAPRDGGAESGASAGTPTGDAAVIDGGGGDGFACTPPSFCAGFESDDAFAELVVNQANGGSVSTTAASPHEGARALRLSTNDPDAGGYGEAYVAKLIAGKHARVACSMWLRAPGGWAGQWDILWLDAFNVPGFTEWRVGFGVSAGHTRVATYAKPVDDVAIETYPKAGGAIVSAPGEWVQASFAVSKTDIWRVDASIAGVTVQSVAEDPTSIADATLLLGLHLTRYADQASYALDVDDVRCAVTD